MFTKEQLAKWRAQGFEFDSFYDEVAVDKPVEEKTLKEIQVERSEIEQDQYTFNYINDPISINGQKYDYTEIKKRISVIKKKLKVLINDLNAEEKLILDLPLIQWKLNYKHGAVMILHWLEGSKKSINLPYKFFLSEPRVSNIDIANLKEYFKNIRYLSVGDLGYYPSNPDGINLFLFNDSIPAIKNSLDLFTDRLKKETESFRIGDFKNIATHIDEKVVVKDNIFQSFSIGSAFGNMDDIGTSLGRYSFRTYFKGIVNKDPDNKHWYLNIEEVAGRFIDEFSFNDKNIWYNPATWKSQNLGCWSSVIGDGEEPDRWRFPFEDKICIENIDFRNLHAKAKSKGILLGGDFLIYSDLKIFRDNFLKVGIFIQKVYE